MTAREVIETAVKLLEDQETKTRHIARYSDINKIRREHLRQLCGVLQAPVPAGLQLPWESLVRYELNLARVIISEHKRATR